MKSGNWAKTVLVLLLGALCFALAVSTNAQIQTEKSATVGRTTMQVQVERGEVVPCGRQRPRRQDGGWHHSPFPQFTGKRQGHRGWQATRYS